MLQKTNRSPKASFLYSPPNPSDLDILRFIDQSSDLNGEVTKWNWSFGDGNTSNEQNPSHRYKGDGTYTVKLTVTDDQGATDTAIKEIKVSNVPPKADFTFSPFNPVIKASVTFDASNSSDPDGKIKEYHWDFGDGTDSTEPNPIHQYSESGTFTVTLTVTHNDGLMDKATQTVLVEHKDFIKADFTFTVVDEDLHKVKLDASASISTMGEIVRYEWDWDGDGTYDTAVFVPRMTHCFDGKGPYKVILTIVDDQGNRDNCAKEVSP